MKGRQYNIDIDTCHGRVECKEYERKQVFDIPNPKCSDSFKKNGDTYMIVGAPNKVDAILAAIQQLHVEVHNLQEQIVEKQKAVEILTKYCYDEIGGRNQ